MKLCLVLSCLVATGWGCGFPGAPAHSSVTFSADTLTKDTVATYSCDRGFELLGPARKVCGHNGTWSPSGIPFCVLNVAAGKAPMQSSVADGGIPQKAVDGSTASSYSIQTCTLTNPERKPWWYVNLLEPYMVQLVRLDFGQSCCGHRPATVTIRVGNNRPDLGVNPVCNRFVGFLEEGRPLFLPCNPPMPGAFVSVHFDSPSGRQLSICEAFVYTDQALPIERCPSFRDQPPGSTATYNGKCYIFYNQQPRNFDESLDFCGSRGGSLVDETNPALQGFLSWELWRRHRGDPTGQYWLGAVRDPEDPNNWKWINGRDVTVSFWNLPGGNENCARFDGTKGWLWADTNCMHNLNFICQHRPKTCGKPEQPPNSTMIAPDFLVGTKVIYECDLGHAMIGPPIRTCLNSGFFDEFSPICKYLECGLPAPIRNGEYTLINGTRQYLSMVQYQCEPGFTMIGKGDLTCDFDQRWNGPPPRCEYDEAYKPDLMDIRKTAPERPDVPGYEDNSLDSKGTGSNPARATVLPPVEYDISSNHDIKKSGGQSVESPGFTTEDDKGDHDHRLHIGGIIALGLFGGIVFLAAIITTITILIRRTQNPSRKDYIRRSDDTTISSESSGSDTQNLNQRYKRAWENLGDNLEKGGNHPRLSRGEAAAENPPDFRSTRSGGHEGLRDGSEMTVNDVAAMYTQPDKKRHHHHHDRHHKAHNYKHDRHERDWRERDRDQQSRRY